LHDEDGETAMLIIPAIDLQAGRCVRLRQGDFAEVRVYADDPVAVAREFARSGAPRLHLVDLDGARTGSPQHWPVVRRIVSEAGIPCQFGGGLRCEADLQAAWDCGVSWCIVGTRAFQDPAWFESMVQRYPQRLYLSVDVRDGLVATHGWQNTTTLRVEEVLERFADWPLAGFIITDIGRDGMLCGVDARRFQPLVQRCRLPLIASGGISSLADLAQLQAAGVAGCIIGKALYEGRINLHQALKQSPSAC
jgi:phosphoribosylformimino-5-aminoimidazole carboxamide ribotide isomerase